MNALASPDLTYTLPPLGLLMPQAAQAGTLAVFGGGAAFLVLYACYLAFSRRSWLPVLFLFGGLFSIMLEPMADVLGNVIHPPAGQDFAFQAEGHPVPWHVVFGYIWYYGMLNIFLYDRFVDRSMTPALWWKTALVTGVSVTIVEQIPIYLGVWVYYGVHPIKLGLMPLSMAAPNCASVMIPSLIIYRLMPILSGWKQWLVPLIVPCLVIGTHAGASVPSYTALGQDTASMPLWILVGGVLLTAVYSIGLIWLGIALVHNLIPEAASESSKASAPAPAHRPTSNVHT